MSLKKIREYGRKEVKVLVCATLLLAALLMTGFANAKTVRVIADGRDVSVSTLYANPDRILNQVGVTLNKQDAYRLSTDQVKDNTVITVYRAVPVTVEYQGRKETIYTSKPTVGEVIRDLGYSGDGYAAIPGETTTIQENLNIQIKAVKAKLTEREEQAPYEVLYQDDPSMEQGVQRVIQEGQYGVNKVKVKEIYRNNVKAWEDVVESTVVSPSRPQVVAVGSRDAAEVSSRGAGISSMHYGDVITMEASAYLPSDGGGSGITASGMVARRGVVAVDPNVIPLGTRLFIPGYGEAVAADTGGAIVGDRIDLCMEDYGEAMDFGRRDVQVYILK